MSCMMGRASLDEARKISGRRTAAADTTAPARESPFVTVHLANISHHHFKPDAAPNARTRRGAACDHHGLVQPLPIDAHLGEITAAVRARRFAVVVAPPGAGKTTRVPPALVADGPLILLQPRRVAARALARRIAFEQGWRVGDEIGWQVRFERRFGARTRLLVATEGILTARLQSDPLLGDFRTVVLDEFHERSLHADLALALARQAARARDDLRVVVMSATLDARAVASFLDGCPVIEVPGRPHPVEIAYAPGLSPDEAVRRVRADARGHVVVFLPGLAEIRRAASDLEGRLDGDVRVLPLHGMLDADAQDAALQPSEQPKIILATNVAETSLTVEGVADVIDSGLQRVLRYDADKGLDRLETERVARDSAEQRAGRAGRTGPGRCLRLWDARERLRPRREPEIERVDLCAPLLDVIAWGGDPLGFEWFEAPPREAALAALELLERLGAITAQRRLTPLGERLKRLPLHPRLGRVLLAAGGTPQAAAACALLSERLPPARGPLAATSCDLLPLIDRLRDLGPSAAQAARELEQLARASGAIVAPPGGGGLRGVAGLGPARSAGGLGDATPASPSSNDAAAPHLRHALLLGYPDRVARRREPGSPRLLLASGAGAVLARESGVVGAEFLLALDVSAGARGPGSEALVRLASAVEPEWLAPTRRESVHLFDAASQTVRAFEREWYEALPLREIPRAPEPEAAAALLVDELKRRGPGEAAEAVLRRVRFAGLEVDLDALLRAACAGRRALPALDLLALLPFDVKRRLEALAPEAIAVPSGRRARLDYRDDGSVFAAVKLQELFGLGETPRLGPRREPVTFELLAPNGRPVQTTRDLRSFWERTYAEVRKELRGRYPKHPWPDDPWTAPPTARTKRRS
jgi:ATP-dependent helicase HrpB